MRSGLFSVVRTLDQLKVMLLFPNVVNDRGSVPEKSILWFWYQIGV